MRKQTVEIILDGKPEIFQIQQGKIYHSESLFTADFVDAVRKLGRWPRNGEYLDENSRGLPCFRDKSGFIIRR